MKKAWFALTLCASVAVPASAGAADSTVVGVGTGAVAGAIVGGPIGAVVGAVAGGFIGANSDSARPRYRRRARAATRRRRVERTAPVRARFATRSHPAAGAVRPVSVEQPQSRSAASEVETAPAATGSTGQGWTDPN